MEQNEKLVAQKTPFFVKKILIWTSFVVDCSKRNFFDESYLICGRGMEFAKYNTVCYHLHYTCDVFTFFHNTHNNATTIIIVKQ